MGTPPTPPRFATGEIPTAAKLNSLADWMDFQASKPKCRVYSVSGTSLTTSTNTVLPLDGEAYDLTQAGDAEHHAGTANTVTVRTTGYYRVTGQVTFAANGTGARMALVMRNNAQLAFATAAAASGSTTAVQVAEPLTLLTAGDVLDLRGWQSSGGALSTVGGAAATYLTIEYVDKA